MPRKIEAQITATTKEFKKGIADAKAVTDELHKALDRFGPLGKASADLLEKMGVKSLGAAVGIGTVAAAVGVGAKVVEDAIGQWSEFVGKIDDYQDVTGQSAEASSRQVVAFDELGVSAETAGAGMFKLSQEIAGGNKALEAYGIRVAATKDGTTDLNGTLINIMEAYQGTSDAATKNAIVMAAFGKSGAAMIPILETNTAELKRLEAQVGKVVTDDDIATVREYKIAQKELKASSDELGLSLGQILLPAQKAFVEGANEDIYVMKHLKEAYDAGDSSAMNMGNTHSDLAEKFRAEYRASKTAQEGIDKLAAAHQNAADMALREEQAEQHLSDALTSSLDKTLDYRQALIDLGKAQKDAKDLKGKDAEANLRLERAYLAVADAVLARARATAEEKNQTLTAAEADKIKADALQLLVNKLDRKSPLRKELQAYINELRSIPSDITTNVSLKGARAGRKSGSGGGVQMAEGGIVKATPGGTAVTLGEGGHDEAVVPLNGTGGSLGGGTHFHFHDAVYADGPGLDRLARALIQRARFSPGT